MNSNGRAPTTVETWPGPMKPSRRRSGESSSARSGGTIVTWLHRQEKLVTPSAFARRSVSAVEGAVVSKPMAKNTTSRSGFALAIRSASSGEYTMRTSAPSALASSSVPAAPGTRIMSPKQVKMTPGRRATAMPSSTRPIGITQTGQPGPCTSSTFAGSRSSIPYL
jgi:hypothetical protein